ncbi:hypothetical protein Dimus_005758 [Dionaea muscipula]
MVILLGESVSDVIVWMCVVCREAFACDMEPTVVDGNDTEAGHIIVTTIGCRNGQPKEVGSLRGIWDRNRKTGIQVVAADFAELGSSNKEARKVNQSEAMSFP